jgi:hypothetical protein
MRKNQFDKCEEWPAGPFRIKQTNITSFLGDKILFGLCYSIDNVEACCALYKSPPHILKSMLYMTWQIFAIDR